MLEEDLIPEDFDLEEFQEAVERELICTFGIHFHEDEDEDEDSKGLFKNSTNGKGKNYKSGFSIYFYRLGSPLFIAVALLLGFLLGGGNMLVSTVPRDVVVGLIIFFVALAFHRFWNNWILDKEGQQLKEKYRKEAEARKRIALLAAGDILKQDTVKARICLALQDLSNSTFDYYKTVTAVLITFSVTGQLPVTLTPIVVAAVVVMLTKAGVKSYCEGDPK